MSEAPPTRLHTCTVCGKVAPWGKGWSWYGTGLQLDHAPTTIEKVCSAKCQKKHKPSAACRKAAKEARDECGRFLHAVQDDDNAERW